MLRTLHLNDSRGWAGGERQTLLLLHGLRARGHEALLMAQPHGELARRAGAEGLEVEPLKTATELALRGVPRIRRRMREWEPDIVHAHTGHSHMHAWRACRGGRRPALVVSRRVDFSIHKMPFRLSGIKYGKRVDRIVAISGAVRDVLVADGVDPDRIGIVWSGVDPARAESAAPTDLVRQFGLPPDARVVATAATLVEHKGHRYLVDAVPLVRREIPSARFLFLGDGPLRAELRAQAERNGADEAIVFAGHREDVLDLVKASDLFVMPSRLEGLNTSVIDAMLLERPVVVTGAGGLPELIADGERGRVVAPEEPEALAGAIVECLRDPERSRQWAEAAREWARGNTTADRMVEGMLREYEAALRRRNERGGGGPPPSMKGRMG